MLHSSREQRLVFKSLEKSGEVPKTAAEELAVLKKQSIGMQMGALLDTLNAEIKIKERHVKTEAWFDGWMKQELFKKGVTALPEGYSFHVKFEVKPLAGKTNQEAVKITLQRDGESLGSEATVDPVAGLYQGEYVDGTLVFREEGLLQALANNDNIKNYIGNIRLAQGQGSKGNRLEENSGSR